MKTWFSRREWLQYATAAGAVFPTMLSSPAKALEDVYPTMPSNEEIFSWVTDLWQIGASGPYGYRMAGDPSDIWATKYIAQKFTEAGLENVYREPSPIYVSFPEKWNIRLRAANVDEDVPCCFLRYAKVTPPQGVTGEVVYVGLGMPDDIKGKDLRGKIALVDLVSPNMQYGTAKKNAAFFTDANNTLVDEDYTEGGKPDLIPAVHAISAAGAAGMIAVLTFRPHENNEYYHGPKQDNHLITGLTVSPDVGSHIKQLLTVGTLQATMTLTERSDWSHQVAGQPYAVGQSYNIYGEVPGTTDETLVFMSHHDGSATNEASGASCVMALAHYYGRLPHKSRRKTLQFFLISSHFGLKGPLVQQAPKIAAMRPRVGLVMDIEMIAKHFMFKDGEYVTDGLVSPQHYNVSHLAPLLVNAVETAVLHQKLDRVLVGPAFGGEGIHMTLNEMGPVIERIAFNAPEYAPSDTPDTVQEDQLRPTACAFVDIADQLDAVPLSELQALGTTATADELGGRPPAEFPKIY